VVEFNTKPPLSLMNKGHWNALLDHGLEKTSDFIIRKSGTNYQSVYGFGTNQSGKIFTQGTSLGTVVDGSVDQLSYNGGKIFLNLRGIHQISSPITVLNKPLVLEGLMPGNFNASSPQGITHLQLGATDTAIIVAEATGTYFSPLYLRNLWLDGNRSGRSIEYPLVNLKGRNQGSIIERVYIHSVYGNPLKISGSNNNNIRIDKCLMEDYSSRVDLTIGTYLFVSNSYFYGSDISGFYLNATKAAHFINCSFENHEYHGLYLNNVTRSSIVGCDFGDNNQDGGSYNDIELSGTCHTITITGNVAYEAAAIGEPLYNVHIGASCDYININGNVFRGVKAGGTMIYIESGGNINGEYSHNSGW